MKLQSSKFKYIKCNIQKHTAVKIVIMYLTCALGCEYEPIYLKLDLFKLCCKGLCLFVHANV